MSRNLKKTENYALWTDDCGPLKEFFEDSDITEIMVNGPFRIFVEKKGMIKKTSAQFKNESELRDLINKIVKASGKEISAENPCVDTVMPDGSRVNCVIPPVAVEGPALTIRKFSKKVLNHKQLIANGAMDEKIAYFLSCCILAKINLIVSGGTGSGKTTLLNVLSSFIPPHERIVSIEDSPELKLASENWVRLESRPASLKSKAVNSRDLVINALRMRPDRIIVGECRGPEAIDMLSAMNTGHEGSLSTLHANSAREALKRLETMILLSGNEMPLKIVRQHISGALQAIVHVKRDNNGVRRISEIIEISGMEGETILTQDIFSYDSQKAFVSSGFVPRFVKEFKKHNVNFPPDFFAGQYTVKNS